MHLFVLLLLILNVWCQIHQISANKFHCEFVGDEGMLWKMYGTELAANDGTGELREFVCELEAQNSFVDKLFLEQTPFCQKIVMENDEKEIFDEIITKNKAKMDWTIVEREKPELTRIFMLLQDSFNALKKGTADDSSTILKELKNQVIEAAFLIADQLQIPHDQILPVKSKRQLMLLKGLAKLWIEWKFCGKRTESDSKNDQNDSDDNGGKDRQNKEENYEKARKRQREMLQLILSVVDDGSIEALKIATKGADESKKRLHRRKKRMSHLAIYLIVAAAVLCLLFCLMYSFCLRPACVGGHKSAKSSGKSIVEEVPMFSLDFKVNDNYPFYHPRHYLP